MTQSKSSLEQIKEGIKIFYNEDFMNRKKELLRINEKNPLPK